LSLLTITLDNGETSLINSLASLMMLVLIFYHLLKSRFPKKNSDCCSHEHQEESSTYGTSFTQTSFDIKPPIKGSNFSLKPKK